jgi:hypothetical protein
MLWFDLSAIAHGSNFHQYMRAYASWLISKGVYYVEGSDHGGWRRDKIMAFIQGGAS